MSSHLQHVPFHTDSWLRVQPGVSRFRIHHSSSLLSSVAQLTLPHSSKVAISTISAIGLEQAILKHTRSPYCGPRGEIKPTASKAHVEALYGHYRQRTKDTDSSETSVSGVASNAIFLDSILLIFAAQNLPRPFLLHASPDFFDSCLLNSPFSSISLSTLSATLVASMPAGTPQ